MAGQEIPILLLVFSLSLDLKPCWRRCRRANS